MLLQCYPHANDKKYIFEPPPLNVFPLLFLFFFHGWIADEICGNADEMPTNEECGGETHPHPPRDIPTLHTLRFSFFCPVEG